MTRWVRGPQSYGTPQLTNGGYGLDGCRIPWMTTNKLTMYMWHHLQGCWSIHERRLSELTKVLLVPESQLSWFPSSWMVVTRFLMSKNLLVSKVAATVWSVRLITLSRSRGKLCQSLSWTSPVRAWFLEGRRGTWAEDKKYLAGFLWPRHNWWENWQQLVRLGYTNFFFLLFSLEFHDWLSRIVFWSQLRICGIRLWTQLK